MVQLGALAIDETREVRVVHRGEKSEFVPNQMSGEGEEVWTIDGLRPADSPQSAPPLSTETSATLYRTDLDL